MKSASLAQVKAHLSEFVGEVAHGKRSVLITKRGRPMAKLIPVDPPAVAHPARIKGWMDANDPFLKSVDRIVAERAKHRPRPVKL